MSFRVLRIRLLLVGTWVLTENRKANGLQREDRPKKTNSLTTTATAPTNNDNNVNGSSILSTRQVRVHGGQRPAEGVRAAEGRLDV